MAHDVEIDEARLDAGFDQFANQGAAALPPGQEYIGANEAEQESEWLATLVFAFSWLNQYAPNWQVPEEKIVDLAEKGAAVMDQMFPHGPGNPEKLPPWAQFLVCLGGIVIVYGFDFETFTLKPLREPDPEEDEATNETNEPQPEAHSTGGRFSTMGSPDNA